MTRFLTRLTAAVFGVLAFTNSSSADVFELRTYTTNEGKLDNLNARFRDHTVALFKKHGMQSVGYWVPTDEEKSKNTLIYVISHKSRDAAKASWTAFLADPEWKKVAAESQKDGQILAKRPESVFMETTKYSPTWKNGEAGDDDVFELRMKVSSGNSTPVFRITPFVCSRNTE